MGCLQDILGDCSGFFTTFGFLAASYIALKLLYSTWKGIRCFYLNSGIDFKKLGEWAVVTGSTDGIGKGYAHELAKRGMNIVLVSRSQDKLDDVAAEIKSKSNVQTRTIAIDFTGGPEIYHRIDENTKDLDVGVLVNNVGMSYDYPEYFAEVSSKKKMDLINVNVTSVTMMTHYFLPRMIAKGKGAIVNISSASACLPQPLLTVYSACKVYMDFFTRALQEEYKTSGVIFQSVKPYFVATKLSKIRKSNFFIPSPNSYARAALNTVGVQGSTYGCISHDIQGFVANRVIPDCLTTALGKKAMLSARKRALSKKQSKSD